jgi:hypothetical protein
LVLECYRFFLSFESKYAPEPGILQRASDAVVITYQHELQFVGAYVPPRSLVHIRGRYPTHEIPITIVVIVRKPEDY